MFTIKKKKALSCIFTALFLLLCLLPSLGMVIFGSSKAGANEILASRPKLHNPDGSFNAGLLSDTSAYLSDRFFLRQEAITLRNRICVDLFSTSPVKKVALGKEDWLFYAEPLYAEPLNSRELFCAEENLRLMQEYTESRDMEFLFVLCPNKSTLCPAEVSVGTPSEDGRRLETLLRDHLVSHCSLYEALFSREEYFYHCDSHWNALGAAAAADSILSSLDKPSGFATIGFSESGSHRGDLSEMLYPVSNAGEPEYSCPLTFHYTSAYRAPNDPTITAEGPGDSSLFCYRDSFGNDLHPFLAESFAKSEFSRKAAYDLISPEADVLIIELVERNLSYLWRYDALYPAPKRVLSLPDTLPAEPLIVSVNEESGFTRISGSLEDCDNAPIYLLTDTGLYECAPKPQGFTLCLEDFPRKASVVYQSGGLLYSAPLAIY